MQLTTKSALQLWRGALVETVKRDTPDLSARQMAVLLTVYMTDGPHTVRGLSKILNVSKPAITRALDKLSDLDLIKRKTDEADRRNVLLQRTVAGSMFLNDFAELVRKTADELSDTSAPLSFAQAA